MSGNIILREPYTSSTENQFFFISLNDLGSIRLQFEKNKNK